MTANIGSNVEQELLKERNFSFNKQNFPNELQLILNEIENNKRKWKSLYMAVWGLPLYYLDPELINKNKGDELIKWGLPAARLKQVLYTPNELKKYLTSYDMDIHISQLINIFTLLENYFFAYYEITKTPSKENLFHKIVRRLLYSSSAKYFSKKNRKIRSFVDKTKNKLININNYLDFTKFQILKKYLKNNRFADKTGLLELEFAKETRNSYVHRRGLVDRRWLRIYNKTSRKKKYKLGDNMPLHFHDLEEWTDLMIKIIENSIKVFNKK